MKRILTTLAVLLSTAVALQAKPVDPDVLFRAARHMLNRPDVVDATPASFTGCRLFCGSDGQGFVLLADDDAVRPLLGYSPDGTIDADRLPVSVAEWIDGYQRDIARAKELGLTPSARAAAEWAQLLGGRAPKAAVAAVEPLLKTKWGQGQHFNEWCPYDSAALQHVVTGCVATAAAQVMRYWKHPEVGRGSHAFDHPRYGHLEAHFDTAHYRWNKMPVTFTNITSASRVDAVSQLIYHVGVAVEMDYGVFGSGAYSNPLGNVRRASSETALKEYFRYNPGLFSGYKEGYTDAQWRAMIDADLDAARPVIYDGYGPSGGHSFVLDGRDTMGLYHFNWGWEGTANGYFTLDSLAPESDMSFSQLNSAIFRIYPITVNEGTSTVSLATANPHRGTVSGSGTYSADSLRITLLATAAPGYRFDHWTSGNPANPIITSPTLDYADTAVFVPLHRDSVGYCRANGIAYKNLTEEDSVEWGIRIPAAYLAGKERLREVHFWTYEASGPYHLRLYRGALPEGEPFYTDSLMAAGYGMNIYQIPESVGIDFADTTPLWVTIYAKGSPFPVSYSHYTGTDDGSWIRYGGQWAPIDRLLPFYASWMLRALLDPSTHVGVGPAAGIETACEVRGRTVGATAPAGTPLALYDVQGRCLGRAVGSLSVRVPAAGIYVLSAPGATPRKVVVQ